LKALITILITLLLSFGSRLSGSNAEARNCIYLFSNNSGSDNASSKILKNKNKNLSEINLLSAEETDSNLATGEDNTGITGNSWP